MNWLAWLLLALAIVGVLLVATGWWRFVFTAYNIIRVTPYEQPGGGAGSIYVIGDSTGYGTGASRSEDSVVGRLGNDYTWYTIHNDSVNGRTIAGAQTALEKVKGTPDVLLFQIGANDILAGRSVEVVMADMQTLVESARLKAANIVVISYGNIGATPRYINTPEYEFWETLSREYDQAMLQLTRQYQNVSFVSLFEEPEADPFIQRLDELISADGLHPTSAGYAIWYQKAKPAFDAVLDSH